MHGMRFLFDNTIDKFREQVVKYNYFMSSILTFEDNNLKLVKSTFVVSFTFFEENVMPRFQTRGIGDFDS